MMELPKNRTLKGLVYATTIAVALCYAWLTARLLEPAFVTPLSVATSVFTRDHDKIGFFEDVASEHPSEALRLGEELEWAESKLQLLGALSPTLRIVVELDRADRLAVTSDRIEIGTTVLRASGQLKKAVLKAWLLQRISPDVTASFLRLEVASDFLLAVLDGGLKLEAPGEAEPRESLSYDLKSKSWWAFADSYQGMCKSPWRSLELQSLCLGQEKEAPSLSISNLSFRPFLGQQLWQSYMALPVGKREAFVHKWLSSLEGDSDSTVSAATESISELNVESGSSDWPTRLKDEMEHLLASDLDPLKEERAKWDSKVDAPLIVIDEVGEITAPGTLKVAAEGFQIQKTKLTFLTSCMPPTLKTLVSLPIESKRVVWKPECAEHKGDFIQVRPTSIALALKRGLAQPEDRLDLFVNSGLQVPKGEVGDLLGLRDAKWDSLKKSFKVRGAIEAVEEFRLDGSAI